MIELLIAGVAVAGIGLWRALSQNENNYETRHRGQPQLQQPTRAPGAVCTPGRDGYYTGCYAPGEYQREQRAQGIGREAAADIRARLDAERQGVGRFAVEIDELMSADDQTINQRIAELTAGQPQYTGDWGPKSRPALPDPNTVEGEWFDMPNYQNVESHRR